MKIDKYIEEHNKKKIVGYCEAIIFPNGDIEDAIPSHTYKLIAISGKSQDEISEIMPMEAGPVAWLVDYTNCVSVWYDFGMLPENLTQEQEKTLQKLIDNGVISYDFKAVKNFEMKICNLNKNMREAENEEEFKIAKKEFDDFWADR